MFCKVVLLCTVFCIAVSGLAFAQADVPYSMLDPRLYTPGVDPDPNMFIRSWRNSLPRNIHGSLVVRDILTELEGDDHLRPTRKGAVLTTLISVSYATLEPNASTTPFANKGEQELYYINSGEGIITSGGKTFNLNEGIGLVLPPGVEYTMTNTCNSEHPTMYRVVEPIPRGFKLKKELAVTNEYDHTQAISVHWANIDRSILSTSDGTAVVSGFTAVKIDPMTMAQPHSHQEGVEEVWIALKGDITLLLGKQLFKLPVGSAYKIPENGITAHANINVSDKQIKLMHMMHIPENAIRRLR